MQAGTNWHRASEGSTTLTENVTQIHGGQLHVARRADLTDRQRKHKSSGNLDHQRHMEPAEEAGSGGGDYWMRILCVQPKQGPIVSYYACQRGYKCPIMSYYACQTGSKCPIMHAKQGPSVLLCLPDRVQVSYYACQTGSCCAPQDVSEGQLPKPK
jgi:hypothetical protein